MTEFGQRIDIAIRMRANPVEPPMGRRHARYRCPVEDCENVRTEKMLMCKPCWQRLPSKVKAGHRRHWKDCKAAGWPYKATRAFMDRCIDEIILSG